jgi:hypothetical protein
MINQADPSFDFGEPAVVAVARARDVLPRRVRAACVGGCRQPSSNLYFIIATIMIIIIKAI